MGKKMVVFMWAALLSLSGWAQSTQMASVASIDNLLRVTRVEEMSASMIEKTTQMMNQTVDELIAREKIPADKVKSLKAVQAKMTDLLKQEMDWKKIKPIYVQIYSETYTQQEIDDLVAFYQTPTGQALIRKQPIVFEKSMVAMRERTAPAMARFFDEIKQEMIKSDRAPASRSKK